MTDAFDDAAIHAALARDMTIDITTTGRRSGKPRRIGIWYVRVDGRYFITGTPGPRGWYANLLAEPRLTFHLKESMQVDLPARAVPIADPELRRRVLTAPEATWYRNQGWTVDDVIATSPMVEVLFDE